MVNSLSDLVRAFRAGWPWGRAATPNKLSYMAEAVSKEAVSNRIAQARESLTLLADYL
jgi:hypothetical protein